VIVVGAGADPGVGVGRDIAEHAWYMGPLGAMNPAGGDIGQPRHGHTNSDSDMAVIWAVGLSWGWLIEQGANCSVQGRQPWRTRAPAVSTTPWAAATGVAWPAGPLTSAMTMAVPMRTTARACRGAPGMLE
jgi:hypothetical protein